MTTMTVTVHATNMRTGKPTVFHDAMTDGDMCYTDGKKGITQIKPPYSVEVKIVTGETEIITTWRRDV
jgi:hypothetical protein